MERPGKRENKNAREKDVGKKMSALSDAQESKTTTNQHARGKTEPSSAETPCGKTERPERKTERGLAGDE